MEAKYNQATTRRPTGTRPIDADLIPIDLQKHVEQLKQEKAYQQNGKNAVTLFKSNKLTITLVVLQAQELIYPAKTTPDAVLSLQVLDGMLGFDNQGNKLQLNGGAMVVLHQPLNFKAKAITHAVCLITLML